MEAKKLKIQVLDFRNRILRVECPDTVRVMTNLAVTYCDWDNTERCRS